MLKTSWITGKQTRSTLEYISSSLALHIVHREARKTDNVGKIADRGGFKVEF